MTLEQVISDAANKVSFFEARLHKLQEMRLHGWVLTYKAFLQNARNDLQLLLDLKKTHDKNREIVLD